MKIAITNNTGLRNRGCEALVVSLIQGLERHLDTQISLDLHTNDPVYDKWRLKAQVNTVASYLTMAPNHLETLGLNNLTYSLLCLAEKVAPKKLKGISLRQLSLLRESDLVLPTGGDIFTSDYGNVRKHLSSIVALEKKKAALVGHTVGPFRKEDEVYFKKAINQLYFISVRESESFEYLSSLNLDLPIYQTADVAFGLPVEPKMKCIQWLKNRYGLDVSKNKFVALSVSEGVIRYSGLEREKYFSELGEFVRRLNLAGKYVLFVPHVMERNPNNNDLLACEELFDNLKDSSMCRILSGEYSASQFKGFIGLSECLIGARTHATIASISQGIPTVSIAYSRKAYGIMSDVFGKNQGEALTISATNLSADALEYAYTNALKIGDFSEAVFVMKDKAEENYRLLKTYLENNRKL